MSTPMTFNREPGIMTITAEMCARGTLNDMGTTMETDGHISHKIQNWFFEAAPRWIFNIVL